jgi:hypothetical protein
MRLSKGKLDLANLQDAVFLDEQAASIQFDFHGQRFDWDFKVNGDWVDPSGGVPSQLTVAVGWLD